MLLKKGLVKQLRHLARKKTQRCQFLSMNLIADEFEIQMNFKPLKIIDKQDCRERHFTVIYVSRMRLDFVKSLINAAATETGGLLLFCEKV